MISPIGNGIFFKVENEVVISVYFCVMDFLLSFRIEFRLLMKLVVLENIPLK